MARIIEDIRQRAVLDDVLRDVQLDQAERRPRETLRGGAGAVTVGDPVEAHLGARGVLHEGLQVRAGDGHRLHILLVDGGAHRGRFRRGVDKRGVGETDDGDHGDREQCRDGDRTHSAHEGS